MLVVRWSRRFGPNVLWRRIHQVELARVLEHLADAAVTPQGCDGLADSCVQRFLGVWIHGVFDEVIAVLVVAGYLGLDLELPHGADEGFRAVDDVLVYRQAVHGELLLCVAVLVDDLHLLDNGRLAALARTCSRVSLPSRVQAWALSCVPSSRILHSRRSRRESSSSLRSMAWLRFFCSPSSGLELMQMPIVCVGGGPNRGDGGGMEGTMGQH